MAIRFTTTFAPSGATRTGCKRCPYFKHIGQKKALSIFDFRAKAGVSAGND
jgi:hypothetical protein